MSIPSDSSKGQRYWLRMGRVMGWWTIGVVSTLAIAIAVLLVLAITGVIQLKDN
jgi:hypothetical protein